MPSITRRTALGYTTFGALSALGALSQPSGLRKDATLAFESIPDEEAITRELFPDQETFRREEQRRFELIVEHLDLPVLREDVSTW